MTDRSPGNGGGYPLPSSYRALAASLGQSDTYLGERSLLGTQASANQELRAGAANPPQRSSTLRRGVPHRALTLGHGVKPSSSRRPHR